MEGFNVKKVSNGILRRKFAPALEHIEGMPLSPLIDPISKVTNWKTCLIHASPGCGKTTLLLQCYDTFLKREGCLPIWVTLDADDASLERFSLVFTCALQQASPTFSTLVGDITEQAKPRDILVDAVNQADELCDSSITYILIFDNYDAAVSGSLDEGILFRLVSLSCAERAGQRTTRYAGAHRRLCP